MPPPIAVLEQRGLDYILGVRERGTKEVREVVMADQTPSVPLVLSHKGRPDTELLAKAVKVGDRRYIVCRNLAEAAQAARTREAVLTTLPPAGGLISRTSTSRNRMVGGRPRSCSPRGRQISTSSYRSSTTAVRLR